MKPSRESANPKTGKKTATVVSPRSGAPLTPGAHAGNTGGKKGRSGRKPDALKAACAEALDSPDVQDAVRRILSDADHPAWATVFKAVASYAYGPP